MRETNKERLKLKGLNLMTDKFQMADAAQVGPLNSELGKRVIAPPCS